MKARWKILIAAGILFLLAAVSAWLTAHRQPENAVAAYKELLRAKGEKLEVSDVLPPRVPDESNGVSLAEAAFKSFVPGSEEYSNLPPAMRMIAPGKALVGWAQPYWIEPGSNNQTDIWENAEAAVEANRFATDLLRQAAEFPAISFQLDYSKGFELLLPHLAPLKRSAQRLSAAAMCGLHNGDAASATTNICILLSLVQADHNERLLISQLVRIAMASFAVSASWELLQSTNVTDAELAMLQKNWERQEFLGGMKGAFEFERAMGDVTIQKLRASDADFNRVMGGYGSGSALSFTGWGSSGNWFDDAENFAKAGLDNAKHHGAELMWRESWSYSDELHALQAGQIVLEATRAIQTNQIFEPTLKDAMTKLDKLHTTSSGSGWMANFNSWLGGEWIELFSSGMFANGNALKRILPTETSRRIVITAIALKRFQLKHGNFPEKLSELTPEYLAAVPLDPVDGKPLRYHPNADGTFLLYSVGDDGADDGGDATPVKPSSSNPPSWNWQRACDWVWPQPASADEVKNYYDEQAAKAAAVSATMPGIPPPPSP